MNKLIKINKNDTFKIIALGYCSSKRIALQCRLSIWQIFVAWHRFAQCQSLFWLDFLSQTSPSDLEH